MSERQRWETVKCQRCGAYVSNTALHDRWHNNVITTKGEEHG